MAGPWEFFQSVEKYLPTAQQGVTEIPKFLYETAMLPYDMAHSLALRGVGGANALGALAGGATPDEAWGEYDAAVARNAELGASPKFGDPSMTMTGISKAFEQIPKALGAVQGGIEHGLQGADPLAGMAKGYGIEPPRFANEAVGTAVELSGIKAIPHFAPKVAGITRDVADYIEARPELVELAKKYAQQPERGSVTLRNETPVEKPVEEGPFFSQARRAVGEGPEVFTGTPDTTLPARPAKEIRHPQTGELIKTIPESAGKVVKGESPIDQMMRYLESKEVKADEIADTGLMEWATERVQKGKPLTKADIDKHLAENSFQFEDVVYGTSPLSASERIEFDTINRNFQFVDEMPSEIKERWAKLNKKDAAGPAQYANSNYVEPGGTNQRELFVTYKGGPKEQISDATRSVMDILNQTVDETKLVPKYSNRDGHSSYNDVENPIARVRMNDRTGPNGEKLLFVEEVQPPQGGKHYRIYNGKDAAWSAYFTTKEKAEKAIEVHRRDMPGDKTKYEIRAEHTGEFGKMPPSLQKRWADIVLKRVTAFAKENGYADVAWTPGAMQVKRWESALRKVADEVLYDPQTQKMTVKKNGSLVKEYEDVAPEQIKDYIGDEAAGRLMENKYQDEIYWEDYSDYSQRNGFLKEAVVDGVEYRLLKNGGNFTLTKKAEPGELIDYHLIGEFSSRAEAEKAIPRKGGNVTHRISGEEITIDKKWPKELYGDFKKGEKIGEKAEPLRWEEQDINSGGYDGAEPGDRVWAAQVPNGEAITLEHRAAENAYFFYGQDGMDMKGPFASFDKAKEAADKAFAKNLREMSDDARYDYILENADRISDVIINPSPNTPIPDDLRPAMISYRRYARNSNPSDAIRDAGYDSIQEIHEWIKQNPTQPLSEEMLGKNWHKVPAEPVHETLGFSEESKVPRIMKELTGSKVEKGILDQEHKIRKDQPLAIEEIDGRGFQVWSPETGEVYSDILSTREEAQAIIDKRSYHQTGAPIPKVAITDKTPSRFPMYDVTSVVQMLGNEVEKAGGGLKGKAIVAAKYGVPTALLIKFMTADEEEHEAMMKAAPLGLVGMVKKTKNNASGESPASLEALSVEKSRKSAGTKLFYRDTRSGKQRPAIGLRPEDNAINPFDELVQIDANGKETILNRGKNARSKAPK